MLSDPYDLINSVCIDQLNLDRFLVIMFYKHIGTHWGSKQMTILCLYSEYS